jgi:hypothetical protein
LFEPVRVHRSGLAKILFSSPHTVIAATSVTEFVGNDGVELGISEAIGDSSGSKRIGRKIPTMPASRADGETIRRTRLEILML